MSSLARHQCMIYEGPPSNFLPSLAAEIKKRLAANYRWLYLNSPAMTAGMRSYLFAAGVDVVREIGKGSLLLPAGPNPPMPGTFDGKRMLHEIERTVMDALANGYAGLWATGDMSWECGHEKDPYKILEYEWGLEELFRRQPALHGVCQYHLDTLPPDISRQALISHQALFVNDTLSRLNPHFVPPEKFDGTLPSVTELREMIELCVDQSDTGPAILN